jgi:hypothetical protein
MYDIRLDRSRKYLHVVCKGHWDLPTLRRYDLEMRQALRSLPTLGRPSRCLIDTSEFAVQSADFQDPFHAHIRAITPIWPDRVAQIIAKSIVKMQANRVTLGSIARPVIFATEQAAMEWLFSEDLSHKGSITRGIAMTSLDGSELSEAAGRERPAP